MSAVAAVALAACTGGSPEVGSSSSGGGDGSTGDGGTEPSGKITIVWPEEPTRVGVDAAAGHSVAVLRNVAESLVGRDPETMELVGELATDWEQVDDTRWRFHLREGVTFHDGSPFNAEVAAFGLNWMAAPHEEYSIAQLAPPINGPITSAFTTEAVDEYTLDIVLEEPMPLLPNALFYWVIPSMKQLQEAPDTYLTEAIGTGPYQFVSWAQGQSIELTVNPDWWGFEDPEAAHGVPTIKDVSLVFRGEPSVRADMVEVGEADLARWVLDDHCVSNSAVVCEYGTGQQTLVIQPDTLHPALADLRVRQAIGYAVDREAILSSLLGGGQVGTMLVDPTVNGYDPDLEPFEVDMERAKELVAEAKADGVPVDSPLYVVSVESVIANSSQAVQAIAQALNEAGLTGAQPQMMEAAVYFEQTDQTAERGFVVLWTHRNGMGDFGQTLAAFYRSGGRNSMVFDPQLDAIIDEALPMDFGAERTQKLQEAAQHIRDQVWYVPIGQPNQYYALSDRLQWTKRVDDLVLVKEMTLKS